MKEQGEAGRLYSGAVLVTFDGFVSFVIGGSFCPFGVPEQAELGAQRDITNLTNGMNFTNEAPRSLSALQ